MYSWKIEASSSSSGCHVCSKLERPGIHSLIQFSSWVLTVLVSRLYMLKKLAHAHTLNVNTTIVRCLN